MNTLMTRKRLSTENYRYQNSPGVSQNNRCAGFAPAFHDRATGRTELSRFVGGSPAPFHLIDGLPDDWIVKRGPAGNTLAVKSSVIAGFVRNGQFYTREEAARDLRPGVFSTLVTSGTDTCISLTCRSVRRPRRESWQTS